MPSFAKHVKLMGLSGFFLWIFSALFAVASHLVHPQLKHYGPVLFYEGKTIAEVEFSSPNEITRCHLYELDKESDAEEAIKKSALPVYTPPFLTMLQLITNCSQLSAHQVNISSPILQAAASPNTKWIPWYLWKGIIPGTKWCGVGDIASNFEDLGSQSSVDSCCRAHDHCPTKLKAFRIGYGLINLSLYTKSRCECDYEFYSCLKKCTNKLADVVGNFYFNIMKVECIKEEKPFICIENRTEVDGIHRCIRWSIDNKKSKMKFTIAELQY